MDTQSILNSNTQKHSINVDTYDFIKALQMVVNATDKLSSQRPILTYIHGKIDGNLIYLIATNSHRLMVVKMSTWVPEKLNHKDFLINAKFAKKLIKDKSKLGQDLQLSMVDNGLKVVATIDNELQTYIDNVKIDPHYYPDTKGILPDSSMIKTSFDIRRKDIFKQLQSLVKVCKNGKNYVIKLTVNNDKVVISCNDTSYTLNAFNIKSDNSFTVYFNPIELKKCLQHVSQKELLSFNFNGSLSPFMVKGVRNPTIIIAPVKVFN